MTGHRGPRTSEHVRDGVVMHVGKCEQVLPTLPECSFDAVVCDPPYELGFMGRSWDRAGVAFDPATWAAVLRVAKPGAHLLAFGASRTFHRMTVAIEDGGWQIRDCLSWLYGSGFPKSLDVSKAIDKAAGVERGPGRPYIHPRDGVPYEGPEQPAGEGSSFRSGVRAPVVTDPATDDARRWQGWGTALKPAWEPVVLARKPLTGTVARNVLEHGTGALNIDGCRIHTEGSKGKPYTVKRLKPGATLNKTGGSWRPEGDEHLPWEQGREYEGQTKDGRWPANVVLDSEAAAMLDRQSGETGPTRIEKPAAPTPDDRTAYGDMGAGRPARGFTDAGGASRFFYCAKAGSGERPRGETAHPTVKPLDLMRWLVRLVTPPGGVVLDPFAGTGTTAEAALVEGFEAVLIEEHPPYADLIRQRLDKPLQPNLILGPE